MKKFLTLAICALAAICAMASGDKTPAEAATIYLNGVKNLDAKAIAGIICDEKGQPLSADEQTELIEAINNEIAEDDFDIILAFKILSIEPEEDGKMVEINYEVTWDTGHTTTTWCETYLQPDGTWLMYLDTL